MTLQLDDALERFLAWGLVDETAIVEGGLEISSASRRNLHLLVRSRRFPGFFVKQPDPHNPSSRRTLLAEESFYTFCREEPRAAAVACRMPRLVRSSTEPVVLVIELVDSARPLWQAVRAEDSTELPSVPFHGLGQALGTLHATFRSPRFAGEAYLAGLGEESPHFLAVHRPRLGALRQLSPAQEHLLRIVQNEARIHLALDAARQSWRAETVVHGDVRSANVLVADDGSEICLVDWELVQRGDAAWDVGGVLHELLLFWIRGMRLEPELDAAERIASAEYPITAVQQALGTFWRSYLEAAELTPAAVDGLLRRSVSYSGARLVQSAWEDARGAERLSSLAVLLLQAAANVLSDPVKTAGGLYGLPAE